ncbi:hypothetical protein CC1G_00719 [Coprinopsis cinerea okayama7|uniref:Uncharacterized protein n=1 Tax=Coprinopsis cinerea (strain Okayama-7 / 130 / ATCC MYA-4618 / FGSC 9003) TaxID=240176 RepID=A8N3G3_COPC7|nr:hypothetical protein CC1G_00719 [Coprinopsis cinerea okayama7\|eukprot:XP_001829540.1 hypothetical protein CC1G_00719 [Coprinopsis cinerea okayama7\
MLLRRALNLRLAPCLPRNALVKFRPSRPLHTTQPTQYHYDPRPPGLGAKIWYRRDGQPRSKLTGALFVGSALFAIAFLSAIDALDEYNQANYILLCLVFLQKTDITYATTDFTNGTETRNYFHALIRSVVDTSPDVIDEFFVEVDKVLQSGGSEAEQLYDLMRTCASEVHEMLKEIDPEINSLNLGVLILRKMDERVLAVADVVQAFNGGDDAEKVFMYHLIRETHTKDPAARGQDYDSIG